MDWPYYLLGIKVHINKLKTPITIDIILITFRNIDSHHTWKETKSVPQPEVPNSMLTTCVDIIAYQL